jgi:DUF4097 and DUF4098 domain-containing protein YvlB
VKRLLLVIILVVVLAGGGLAVVNFGLDKTRATTRTIIEPVGTIIVRSGAGDVHLVPGSRRVEVRATQHYVFKKPALDVSVRNGVLTVASDCDTPVLRCYTDLRVAVPANVAVTVEADSGAVDAREVRAGSIHAQSDSGDVALGLVGRQRLVWAHTDSGRVDVIAADARAVDAQSDSGDVTVDVFRRAPRRVVARSDSGFVQVLALGGAMRSRRPRTRAT